MDVNISAISDAIADVPGQGAIPGIEEVSAIVEDGEMPTSDAVDNNNINPTDQSIVTASIVAEKTPHTASIVPSVEETRELLAQTNAVLTDADVLSGGDDGAREGDAVVPSIGSSAKESALNEADVASTVGRARNFLPYIHHAHDPSILRSVLDALEADPPVDVRATDAYRALELRQAEYNAIPTCHDCLGMNQEVLLGGILPTGYGTGPSSVDRGGLNATYSSMALLNATQGSVQGGGASLLPSTVPAAHHVGEESVLYPCGRHLTITHLTDSTARRILNTGEKVLGIVAYVVSTDGKYLAVSERYIDHNAITIYRVDSGARVNTLDYRMLARSLVTELHFSSNNRYLVTITAQPEHRLILWLLEEMRVVGICEDLSATPITRIRFNGWHSASLASVASDYLFLWSHLDRDVTAIDILQHHEEQKRLLVKQQYHDKYGFKKGEVQPKSRVVPSSVSKVSLFDGDERRVSSPSFVAVEWYEDKCFAAITDDGWFIAVEDDLRIRMCTRIRLPDRRDTNATTVGFAALPPGQVGGGGTTPSRVSHRPSAVDAADLDVADGAAMPSPSNLSQIDGRGGVALGDVTASALSMLRSMATPQRPPSSATVQSVTGGQPATDGAKRHPHHHLTTIFSGMTWCSRGFLITGPKGWVVLMDRTYDEHSPFVHMASMSVCGPMQSVLSLSVSPGETNMVLALSTNTLSYVSMGSFDDAIDLARADKPAGGAPVSLGRLPSPSVGADASADSSPRDAMSASPSVSVPQTARATGTAESSLFTPMSSARRAVPSTSGGVLPAEESSICAGGVIVSAESLIKPMQHTQFHQSTVTSLSLALQRPYMATSAMDGTVAIYDYLRRKLVCTHKFSDTVVSCSLHPMGTQIVICESFTAGLYAVLDTGLVLLTVIGVRGAQFAKFSANGGRIAFAVSNRVVLFNSATLESMGMLVGHSTNVKGVRWCDNDSKLSTCDVSGGILSWDAYSCRRVTESAHRNIILSSVCGFHQHGCFAAVGTTRQTRGMAMENEFTIASSQIHGPIVYLRPGMIYGRAAVTRKFHTGLLCYAEVSKTLFVGTPTGRVLLYSWPLIRTSRPYRVIDAHEGEVMHMLLSHDEQFLFTIGQDNLCFVHSLQHMKEGRYMAIPSFDYELTDPIKLVGADVQQRNVGAEVEVLKELIKFKGEDIAAGQRILKRAHDKSCLEITRAAQRKVKALKEELAKTKEACKSLVEKGQQERRQADAMFQLTSEAIENQYGKLAETYAAKTKSLCANKESLVVSFEATNSAMLRRWEETKTSLEAGRIEREKQLSIALQRLQQEIKSRARDSEAMIDQTIVDGERDIHRLQTEQTKVLSETLEAIQRVSHVQSFGEREAERLRKEIGSHKDELVTKAIIHSELERQTEQNAQRNASHRNNNKLRQDEINVAEKSLQQLRQQLGSLENLRFVLIHQFEQLQSEIEPKEARLRQLERAIGEREGLLSHVHRERNELKEQLDMTNAKLDTANRLYRTTMLGKHAKGYGVSSVISELSKVVDEHGGNETIALAAFKEILNRNVHRGGDEIVATVKGTARSGKGGSANLATRKTGAELLREKMTNDELDRQAHYLKCQHESLVRSIAEKSAIADISKQAFREESERYLKDIRQLQEERRQQAESLKGLESQLRDTRLELHSVIDAFEAQRRQQELEARQNEANAQALPPTSHNLSSVSPASSSTAVAVPTRGRSSSVGAVGAAPLRGTGRAGAARHFGSGLPPLRVTKSSEDARSPLRGGRGAFKLRTNSSPLTPAPVATTEALARDVNDNDSENNDDLVKKPSRIAGKAKRNAKERLAQRDQLQTLIGQLDRNTDVMRAQQEEAHQLRLYVKELLAKEEVNVARQVGDQLTTELPMGGGAGGGLAGRASQALGTAPMLLRIVADGKQRGADGGAAADRKLVISMSTSVATTRSATTITGGTAATHSPSAAAIPFATRMAPEDDDDAGIVDVEDGDGLGGDPEEDVDWAGQQARPMTPVRGPM